MYQKILVASDASDGGLNAVSSATNLAAKYGAKLTALHVYEMPPFQSELMGAGAINGLECVDPRMLDDWMASINLTTRQKIETVLNAGGVSFTYRQEAGQTANTIVRVAKEEQIDLIVLGSRGLSGLQAFLLGSVSERVAHLAHCSVLIDRLP